MGTLLPAGIDNLTPVDDRFVGDEDALNKLHTALQTRPVVLTGPGRDRQVATRAGVRALISRPLRDPLVGAGGRQCRHRGRVRSAGPAPRHPRRVRSGEHGARPTERMKQQRDWLLIFDGVMEPRRWTDGCRHAGMSSPPRRARSGRPPGSGASSGSSARGRQRAARPRRGRGARGGAPPRPCRRSLPLAAAFVAAEGIRLDTYRNALRSASQRVSRRGRRHVPHQPRAPRSGGSPLMQVCSLLAPREIPLDLFLARPASLPPALRAQAEVEGLAGVDAAAGVYRRYGILERERGYRGESAPRRSSVAPRACCSSEDATRTRWRPSITRPGRMRSAQSHLRARSSSRRVRARRVIRQPRQRAARAQAAG